MNRALDALLWKLHAAALLERFLMLNEITVVDGRLAIDNKLPADFAR